MSMRWFTILAAGLAAQGACRAADSLSERVEEALTFSSEDNVIRAHFSGLASVEAYQGDQYSPGFIFTTRDTLVNPRLVVYLDSQFGPSLYGFAQVRADKGFDPGASQANVRVDEYLIKFKPTQGLLEIEMGKFATIIGNWVVRHDAWQNPFVSAPLPYEFFTGIGDSQIPKFKYGSFSGGGALPYAYNPIIWGPGYATGAAVAGRSGQIEYAFEVKNAGPSSRPEYWSPAAQNFKYPSTSMRLGFRPDMRMHLGFSVSDSIYLAPDAAKTIPEGRRYRDYRELLLGEDFSFEWHRVQVWAELFEARFAIPHVGAARCIAGYVEARYQFTPQFFGAVRFNRQVFSPLDYYGETIRWGVDMSRIEIATTCRLTAFSQLKLQLTLKEPSTSAQSRSLTSAVQFALRF